MLDFVHLNNVFTFVAFFLQFLFSSCHLPSDRQETLGRVGYSKASGHAHARRPGGWTISMILKDYRQIIKMFKKKVEFISVRMNLLSLGGIVYSYFRHFRGSPPPQYPNG